LGRRRVLPLTLRQWEILLLLVEGKTQRQVARMLGVSATCINQHVRMAKWRLGFETTAELLTFSRFGMPE